MTEINGVSVPFIPITTDVEFNGSLKSNAPAFGSILHEELEKLRFSNHAIKRLETRNIHLGEQEIKKIQSAVERAERKGSKDSLVLTRETAYIVNVTNRTVVTAMPIADSSENIFTNIDSVVFA